MNQPRFEIVEKCPCPPFFCSYDAVFKLCRLEFPLQILPFSSSTIFNMCRCNLCPLLLLIISSAPCDYRPSRKYFMPFLNFSWYCVNIILRFSNVTILFDYPQNPYWKESVLLPRRTKKVQSETRKAFLHVRRALLWQATSQL